MSRYEKFIEGSRPFIEWMLNWYDGLPALRLASIAQQPEQVGIISVDVIKGFTTVGHLASPRINQIVEPIASLFEAAWNRGIRDIAVTQDAHPADAVEFAQYGSHCVAGSEEAETVDAFLRLPFFSEIQVFPKNSIDSFAGTGLDAWVEARPALRTYITVGDCSDICTYQLAMHLRVYANAAQRQGVRVIAPINTIDTYDLPVRTALEIGATPHDAGLLHLVFLYHMMLNGIEIVRAIEF